MEITIFTPTYNRGYMLPKLYDSLTKQTCKRFTWLIVDDGSTDNTYTLVKEWIREDKITIEYHHQENKGKSMAHNKGVELTKTDLFTCVDSDDYLIESAVEELLEEWNREYNPKFVGILAFKGLPNGQSITSIKNKEIRSTSLKKAYTNHGLIGDTMLIFKSDIISRYEFPKYGNEKFVPEAYLYDLIDKDGELLLLPKVLYFCEYLDDGYTKNMAKLLVDNPQGYIAYINQRLENETTIKEKVNNSIRYTAINIASKQNKYIRRSVFPVITIFTWPAAYILYIKRYKSIL